MSNTTKPLVYDIEIIKAVPDKKFPREEGIAYCEGWQDHANMGISVIGAYDYQDNRYRVFCADNLMEFATLCMQRRPLVSFNGIGFDNKVIAAAKIGDPRPDHGTTLTIEPDACYDILRELWGGVGLGPEFAYPSHTGFGLDAVGKANFGLNKSGHGAFAPVEWQQGKIGSVIDYCLNDVRLTVRAFDRIRATGGLRDPRDPSRFIEMRKP